MVTAVGLLLLGLAWPVSSKLLEVSAARQDALLIYAQIIAALGTALAALAAFGAASSSETAARKAQEAAETAERAMALHDPPPTPWSVVQRPDGDDDDVLTIRLRWSEIKDLRADLPVYQIHFETGDTKYPIMRWVSQGSHWLRIPAGDKPSLEPGAHHGRWEEAVSVVHDIDRPAAQAR